MSLNLATILRESRQADPAKPLCHTGDRTFSYAEVDQVSGCIASSLGRLGIGPGDKVVVQLPNVPEFLVSYFGILKAGAVVVPLNPMLRCPEISYHLQDCDAKLLITCDTCVGEAFKAAQNISGLLATYVVALPGSDLPAGTRYFAELYAADDTGELEPTNGDDTAVIIYTSGTTGKPKGAELTHFQLFMNCTVFGELIGLSEDDVVPVVQPMFHVFALSGLLNMVVRYGGTLVLLPGFEIEAVLDTLAFYRCTIFSGVPTMYIALLAADIGGRDLSALRVGLSGGSPIPRAVIREVEERFPHLVILEGYGLSEAGPLTTFNISAEQRKLGSVGKPIRGVQVKVIDDNDAELPRGREHVGEIVISGHNVMKGYYRNPQATADALRGNWLCTGDLGYRDDDGYLFVVDRKKDLIARGGYKIYPSEVEEALFEHPLIAQAAVIGKPDDKMGQEVLAVVVARAGTTLTPEDVIAHCARRLAGYKHPSEVRIVDDLPIGPSGKVLKKQLRP